MKCPDDSTSLQRQNYEGDVQVDGCPECGGIWLDHGELEAIEDRRENDYRAELKTIPNYFDKSYAMALARSEGTYMCPRCERAMEKREYAFCSQVMIDVCPQCRGVWLHDDELSELEVFFERNRLETAEIRKGFLASLLSLMPEQPIANGKLTQGS
jgi:hypothetical protein